MNKDNWPAVLASIHAIVDKQLMAVRPWKHLAWEYKEMM